MYFGDKHETNIDDEFNQENNILSRILKMLSKYKTFAIVGLFLIIIVLMIILFVSKKVTNYLALNGEEIITLYQGADYIEPGFKAYNSKEEDLNSQVIIKSTLDTDEVGEEYIEPGYQVFSGSGVTGQVKVTGTVDTSKKGN